MRPADVCHESVRALAHNRGRTALTALGVVIGIAAVIAMTALVTGVRSAMAERLGLSQARAASITFAGTDALVLTEADVAALGVEKREVVVSYQEGDTVRITDGALESFLGTVEEIDLDRSKVRVVVSMFGRETPVELELDQVEPANE